MFVNSDKMLREIRLSCDACRIFSFSSLNLGHRIIHFPCVTKNLVFCCRAKPQARLEHAALKAQDFQVSSKYCKKYYQQTATKFHTVILFRARSHSVKTGTFFLKFSSNISLHIYWKYMLDVRTVKDNEPSV